MLYVSSLSKLHDTVASIGASHMLTVISEGTPVERPETIKPENHLYLGFHDITEELEGHKPPMRHHVEAILEFGEKWGEESPLVVHCWAGISRSTASAYMIACASHPEADERELAQSLRRAAPSATPNIRMVRFADEVLGRNGRMTAAIEEIGRGADAFEGTPFRYWREDF
ncbi:MAG: protein tyrosine phosphatase [Pseudomonadota bacterium]